MEAWSLNKLEIQTYNAELIGDIIEKIKSPIQDRDGFSCNDKFIIIPRYFYRFIGTHASIDDYKRWLFELDSNLSKFSDLYLKVINGFESTIEQDFLLKLDTAWLKIMPLSTIMSSPQSITAQQVIDILDSYKLVPEVSSPILLKQLKENLASLIEHYFILNNNNIDELDFKSLIYYTCYWLSLYFEKLTINFDYLNINPKILFYGNIKNYEVFFLVLMSTFGIDVLYINSAQDGSFDDYNSQTNSSNKHELLRLIKNVEFPDSADYNRIETYAKQAEEEVTNVLHSSDSGCYKQWQFKDFKLNVKTLATSYSEISVWLKNDALYRPAWDVSSDTVTLSNVFAKISGVHPKTKKYLEEISELSELPNTKFFSKCPISSRRTDEIDKFESIVQYKNAKPFIDKNELVAAQWWPYHKLRQGIQNLLADKICFIINEGILTNTKLADDKEVLIYTFSKLLHIDDWFIELLSNFDYPGNTPKVIVYNYVTTSIRGLTFFDSIMLLLANLTGMDVLLFTPSGYQDIENYINPDLHLYDIHTLEDTDSNLEFKKGTFNFIKKLFS